MREQQEINRRQMERKEKERQKLEQEKRKEKEEEDALEQVSLLTPTVVTNPLPMFRPAAPC